MGKYRNIYFIGIGGIGMSAIARYFKFKGCNVSGYDRTPSDLTAELEKEGIPVHYTDDTAFIPADPSDTLVVYTPAIPHDMGELVYVQEHGYRVLKRSRILGEITEGQRCLAVAGTHGKTTTTSMISHILLEGNADPTISVGGILPAIHGNIRVGQSETFVTEACEYTNSFLSFYPKISIILNIDADHLDFFKDIDDIRHSFRLFAEKLPHDGTLIINGEIPHVEEITQGLPCEIITYALKGDAQYTADNIVFDETAHPSFDCICKGEKIGRFSLSVPGIHNVSNALSAIALARKIGMSTETIQKGLLHFGGTDRRFQYKGKVAGVTVIDDYAHHPTEIAATLKTAQNYPHNRIWCVFQPHTYTRTKALMPEFAQALSLADKVVLADIYPARETDNLGISSKDLADLIAEKGTDVHYFSTFDEIEEFLLKNCIHGDVLITMGAGDVYKIGENLLGM